MRKAPGTGENGEQLAIIMRTPDALGENRGSHL